MVVSNGSALTTASKELTVQHVLFRFRQGEDEGSIESRESIVIPFRVRDTGISIIKASLLLFMMVAESPQIGATMPFVESQAKTLMVSW